MIKKHKQIKLDNIIPFRDINLLRNTPENVKLFQKRVDKFSTKRKHWKKRTNGWMRFFEKSYIKHLNQQEGFEN